MSGGLFTQAVGAPEGATRSPGKARTERLPRRAPWAPRAGAFRGSSAPAGRRRRHPAAGHPRHGLSALCSGVALAAVALSPASPRRAGSSRRAVGPRPWAARPRSRSRSPRSSSSPRRICCAIHRRSNVRACGEPKEARPFLPSPQQEVAPSALGVRSPEDWQGHSRRDRRRSVLLAHARRAPRVNSRWSATCTRSSACRVK